MWPGRPGEHARTSPGGPGEPKVKQARQEEPRLLWQYERNRGQGKKEMDKGNGTPRMARRTRRVGPMEVGVARGARGINRLEGWKGPRAKSARRCRGRAKRITGKGRGQGRQSKTTRRDQGKGHPKSEDHHGQGQLNLAFSVRQAGGLGATGSQWPNKARKKRVGGASGAKGSQEAKGPSKVTQGGDMESKPSGPPKSIGGSHMARLTAGRLIVAFMVFLYEISVASIAKLTRCCLAANL